jgi:excisionase family DNA binding protein
MEIDNRETVGVAEAAEQLGVSRRSAYKAAHSGELPCIKIGKRLLVPRRALERLLDGQAARAAQEGVR